METYADTITLTDQDGSEVEFEVLDIVPYEEREYAVLLPADDDSEQPEVVILELFAAQEEDQEDVLQGVDDEAILQAVYDRFLARNQEG
ncbi:MAG: DUF1292 domain-containing protein [Candidatus Pelethousia sp.]|nr:DUF1292 domain-containing protein [Candidatus Pelethousia sp.]